MDLDPSLEKPGLGMGCADVKSGAVYNMVKHWPYNRNVGFDSYVGDG